MNPRDNAARRLISSLSYALDHDERGVDAPGFFEATGALALVHDLPTSDQNGGNVYGLSAFADQLGTMFGALLVANAGKAPDLPRDGTLLHTWFGLLAADHEAVFTRAMRQRIQEG